MNIALIHLSDFHFKKEDYVIKEKIDKIAEAISIAGNIDECVIIFSGDMSFHGAQDEFPKARFTFSRLISVLKAKYATGYIPLLCVPGNHDLVLSDSSRKFIDIAQYYEDGDIERHLEEEFSAMSNYFAEQPSTNRWSDKLICRYFQRYPDFAIQFNLINTAPFSTLKHDDKELHYYPKERLSALRKHPDANICITVMHHGVEWFEWSCKTDLEKTIFDNSEFLLTGHDHVGSGKNVHFNNDSGVWISAAGSMDFSKLDHEDSFNLIVLNTESYTFDSFLFSWDYQNSVFIHTIMQVIRDIIMCTILNYEDYIASCAVDIKTSSVLFSKEPENSLQEIQKLIIIENSGNTDMLFREIQNILKKASKPHIKMMAKCIMRKHLLCNTQIPFAKKTQIIDRIFGKRARKEFSLPLMNRAM